MGVHGRVPTAQESTPVVPVVDQVVSGVSPLAALFVLHGRRVTDAAGRVWCCVMGSHYGLTRHEGGWWYGRLEVPGCRPRFMVELPPATSAALNVWELASIPADSDPTPPHGIGRPAVLTGCRS